MSTIRSLLDRGFLSQFRLPQQQHQGLRSQRMALDKAPFFVTLAVAVAGWSATYVVGRITNSPTLEYEMLQPVASPVERAPEAKSQRIRLTNLTRSLTFKNLTVVLVAQGGTKILDDATEIIPIAPAFEGNEPWKHQGGMARYTIPKMHPGWTFIVNVQYVGENAPVLRFESEDTIYSTKPNWETFIVRREVWIFSVIAFIWSCFILLYLARNLCDFFQARKSMATGPAIPANKAEVDHETG